MGSLPATLKTVFFRELPAPSWGALPTCSPHRKIEVGTFPTTPKRRLNTPRLCEYYVHETATLQAIFKFTGGYRALYTCIKRFYKLIGALRLGYVIFTGGYRALYTHAQNASTNCDWDAAETLSYLIHGRLRRSLQMHKTFITRNVWEEKCAAGAKKMNTRAETTVSGAKNMVNRPKK